MSVDLKCEKPEKKAKPPAVHEGAAERAVGPSPVALGIVALMMLIATWAGHF